MAYQCVYYAGKDVLFLDCDSLLAVGQLPPSLNILLDLF